MILGSESERNLAGRASRPNFRSNTDLNTISKTDAVAMTLYKHEQGRDVARQNSAERGDPRRGVMECSDSKTYIHPKVVNFYGIT